MSNQSPIPAAPQNLSSVQILQLSSSQKAALHVKADAGARYQLLIDGVPYTGQKTHKGQPVQLKRKGDALRLQLGEQTEPALEIDQFFGTATGEAGQAAVHDAAQDSAAAPSETLLEPTALLQPVSATAQGPAGAGTYPTYLVASADEDVALAGIPAPAAVPEVAASGLASWQTLALAPLLFLGGGSGSASADPSVVALNKISAYDGTNAAPTVADYTAAKVTGVTDALLPAINSFIAPLSSDATDTAAELQAVVDAYKVVLAAAALNVVTSLTALPTLQQLETLGLTGLSADNLLAVQTAIVESANDGSGVDTLSKLQAVVTAAIPSLGAASSESVAENTTYASAQPTLSGRTIGAISWSLEGADAAKFSVNTNGVVSMVARNYEAPADAGADNVYNYTLVATDSAGNRASKAVTVTVTDVNDNAPVFTSGTTGSVNENAPISTAIYTAASTDADGTSANRAVVYSLKPGVGDASLLSIDGATGAVTLLASANYETKSSYRFTVVATNGSLTTEQAVTVSVGDLNDKAPVFTSGATGSVNENAATSTVVYTAASTDADGTAANRVVAYSLKAGVSDEALLSINSSTGAVTLKASADYETKSSYQFTVVATNGSLTTEQAVTVAVNDVVETASLSLTTAATANVAENSAYSAAAPTLVGTPIGSVTYTLSGADAGLFSVNAATGAVSMVARNYEAPADAGADNVYNYTLVATDADGNTASQAVAVTVTDVVETASLSLTTAATANVAENSAYSAAAPTLVGTPIGSVTYTLSGADAGLFSVNAATGAVSMVARNYEAPADAGGANVYNYTLVATDADGNTASQAVAVTVTDVVESASLSLTTPATANVAENSAYSAAAPTLVGTPIGSVTYSLGGADAGLFSVNAATGAVSMVARNYEAPADAGADNVYNYTLVATDADGNTASQAVAVMVTNVDEAAPTFSSGATASAILENSGASQVVYTAAAADTDFNAPATANSVTYSLGGTDRAAFSINAATGAVTLLANPNFEAQSSYSFDVIATDAASNSRSKTVTLAVNNVDEVAPTFSSGTSVSIQENIGANQVVYTAVARDTDFNAPATASSVTYGLGGTDASAFRIDTGTGAVTLLANPDFETTTSYSFDVLATDAAGNIHSQTVSLQVLNVNEAPVVANAIPDQTFYAGGAVDSFQFAANAFSDVDANTTLTYTTSALPSWLSFDAATRTFSGDPTAAGTTTVTVTASDGSLSVSDQFVITAVAPPVLTTALSGVTNFDVRSNIVLSVGETVTANNGGTITLTDLGGAGFRGESTTHSYTFSVTDPNVQIAGTGADTKIILNPTYDLDLSSNYSLAISTGAFKGTTTGLDTAAFSTINFSTVTPGAGLAGAVQAQGMNTATGAMENTLSWFDSSNIGSPSAAYTQLDFSAKNYAAAFKQIDLSTITLQGDSHLLFKNFDGDDLIYIDSQDNTLSDVQSTWAGNMFAAGVGTLADPFWLQASGDGSLGINYVYVQLTASALSALPVDVASNQLLEHVISTHWSNTGMVIAA